MFAPTASPAGVTPGTPLAEWVGTDGPELFAPWMFDGNGAAVILPADVIGFRARYWPEGARGIGELVEDDEGRPVFVPRKATPEDFRALVGYRVGRYKLAALDQSFRFLERAPLVVTSITRAAAERAGMSQDIAPTPAVSAAPASSPSSDQLFGLLSHLLNLLGESHKQATTQNAQLVGSLAGVLNAAGESGTVQKSTALAAAAAGAPVTVQMMPPGSLGAPNDTLRNGNAPGVTVERGGYGEAAMSLIAPLFEKLGPVLAYGTAKHFDVPEDYARSMAGMVQTTAQTVTHMLKTDGVPTTEGAPSAPRVGAELMAHILRIQGALADDDRAWVSSLMSTTPGLVDALRPSVASLSVEEGIGAVRSMRMMDAALTTPAERGIWASLLAPDFLPSVFRSLFVDATPEKAIEFVRARAAGAAS